MEEKILTRSFDIKIIAHRGDNKHFPENTLSAFQSALEKGADAIELDVHMTIDKKIVVHHDYTLGRTNNGEGYIYDKDYSYLKRLDAGSWFSPTFNKEKIPLLSDLFNTFGSTIQYEIEIKGFNREFLVTLLNLVKEYDLIEQIEFTAPPNYLIHSLKVIEPRGKIGVFIQPFASWMTRELGQRLILSNVLLGNIHVAHCPLSVLDEKFVVDLQKQHIVVHGANCDSEIDILRAKELGLEQVSTNNLDDALRLRI